MRPFFLLLASAVFALSACSSNADTGPPIGGTYSGPYTSFDHGYEGMISVIIPNVMSGSTFSFSASGVVDVNGSDSQVVFSGTGEYVFPEIAFTVPGSGSIQDRMLIRTVDANGSSITASQSSVLIDPAIIEQLDATL